jgi:hypothetical protein
MAVPVRVRTGGNARSPDDERELAGVFAALLLVASPAWAQSLSSTISTSADNNGADLANAIDTDGFTADMQQVILDAYNAANNASVASIDALSDQDLADTLQAVLASEPTLATDQVTALVRATIRSRPSIAPQLAAAAATARPDIGGAIRDAAIAVAPDQAPEIRAAVREAVVIQEQIKDEEFVDNPASND